MCIFAGEVGRVSNTNIYVGSDGNRQLTVYEMEYSKLAPRLTRADLITDREPIGNAMILPVPWRGEGRVETVDLSPAPSFFKELDKLIPREVSRSFTMKSLTLSATSDYLPIINVGSYQVSIAYRLEDVDRVDPNVFRLSKDAASTLAEYSGDHAYVVCALRDQGHLHPIAYTAPLVSHVLHIPTRHEHGHLSDVPGMPVWDHSIYVMAEDQVTGPTSRYARLKSAAALAPSHPTTSDVWVRLMRSVPALTPYIPGPRQLYRWQIRGPYPNVDLLAWEA